MCKSNQVDAASTSTGRNDVGAEKFSVADQYLMMGLKLKDDGRVRCMFCHRYATALPEGKGVRVVHTPDCLAAKLLEAPQVDDGQVR
jgi:hypothetical protein